MRAFFLAFLAFSAAFVSSDAEQESEKRLIETAENVASWLTEEEILELIRAGRKFFDITDGDLAGFASLKPLHTLAPPKKLKKKKLVHELIEHISESYMTDFLKAFTGFKTRYFRSASGKASGEWLLSQVHYIGELASENVTITVKPFKHEWGQHSVIARIEPASDLDTNKKKEKNREELPVVIVSAHQDSINGWNPWTGRAPGADDNGSGSTTIFEVFRILVTSGYVPETAIEFHWYSAEEGGLLGSQKVVANYRSNNIPVSAVYHVDMTGYTPAGKKEVIGIATDFTNSDYSNYLRMLVKEYCDVNAVDTKCGYACSDHASWTKAGYPAVFTFESAFEDHSPYIHTTNDVVENVSFQHISQFVRLVLAWAVELSNGNTE